jgi:hypothetical protein
MSDRTRKRVVGERLCGGFGQKDDKIGSDSKWINSKTTGVDHDGVLSKKVILGVSLIFPM